MIVSILLVFLGTCLTLAVGHSHANQSYPDYSEFRIERFRRETAALPCPFDDKVYNFKHWVTPLNKILTANASNAYFLPDNYTLYIKKVVEQDLGDYLCVTERNDTQAPKYIRARLYLYIPPTWEIYRKNFIIAICCSGAFLLIAGLILLVYSCRWKPRHTELDLQANNQPKNGYVNATYELHDQEAANNLDYPEKPASPDDEPDTKM